MKRKKIKTILCHMAIITICAGVFCHGYINGLSISEHDRYYSFAEADNWSSCDTSDLVTAFRYYCKSRNLAIEGSVADALTSFTTTTFNNICSTLGIDPTQLQAELKKTTAGNLGLRFLFSQTGITAYNRIFAEFLQNNDLSVGDENVNKTVYSGKNFTDGDGINSLIYITDNGIGKWYDFGTFQMGTPYRYTGEELFNKYATSQTEAFTGFTHTEVFNLTESVPAYNFSCYIVGKSNSQGINQGVAKTDNLANGTLLNRTLRSNGTYVNYTRDGNLGIVYDLYNQKFYICIVTHDRSNNRYYFFNLRSLDDADADDADITVTSPIINNNTYNNNYTIIYNDGDTYITDDDDEPLPTTPPPGGGGGGGDNPGDDPDDWNPTTPNIPEPSSPSFPTVDLPDIDIPNLPSLNFSLGDLRNKFPFSLPFDIIAVLNVLDGEPQAPHIEATVPIGRWYTWEMDFDFSEFDNYARIFRAFEFIGFCIGLAIFTVHFVKG